MMRNKKDQLIVRMVEKFAKLVSINNYVPYDDYSDTGEIYGPKNISPRPNATKLTNTLNHYHPHY